MAKKSHKVCKYTRLDLDQMIYILRKCVKHDLTESAVMNRCVEAARRGRDPDFSRSLPGYLKGKVRDNFKDPVRVDGYKKKLAYYRELKKNQDARN